MSETIADVNGITNTYSTASVTRSRAYYYDARGRVIQIRESDSDGHAATYSTSYDFAGNVTATIEKHTTPGNVTHTLRTDYTRDARGRVTSCSRTFDGSSLADVTYGYDALGRLAGKEGGQALSESYAYDLHGWATGIEAGRGTDTLFSESIRYSSPQKPEAVPLYSGNISEIASLQYGGPVNTYSYSYDGTSRLTDARHFIGNSSVVSNTDTERSVSYDANGNIMTLTRYGASYADRSVLGFSYTGNRMTGAVDVVNQHSFSFGYDADGNRTSDGRTGLEFSYNILNLPCEVHDGQQNMQMRYTYLSDGTKISALDAAGNGLLYRGNFVYDKTGNTVNLESVAWDEGRIRNTEFLAQHDDELIEIGDTLAVIDPLPDLPWHPGLHTTDDQLQPDSGELVDETAFEHAALFQDQWFVRDHLGNVRSVIDLSGSQNASTASLILEQDDYLPYGTKVVNGSQSSLSSNRYRYAGKEEQRIGSFSSQLLDFGARSYDPWTCRWTAVDPLAQKYFGMSPYNYCGNDPVNFFDPDGMTDYFDNDGNFLYNDGEDNGEMRTLDALHFWGLVIEFVHNSYSSQEANDKLKIVSRAVNNSNLTDDALIMIVSHYNETGYKVRPKDPQKDDTDGDMATVFNPDGTVEICVDVRKCYNKGYFDILFNIINALHGHEGNGHANKFKRIGRTAYFDVQKPQRELDAIESQRNHPSWKRTTESFKSGVKGYEDYYKSLLLK